MPGTTSALTALSDAARFGGRSRWVDLDGPTHVVEYEPAATGTTFVLVHGLGGSYLDWSQIAPSLTPLGRVLSLDLPGFGLSPAAGRSGAVAQDVELVRRFVEEDTEGPVVLIGNSRGGMVSALASAQLERVRGVVLISPALPMSRRGLDPQALVELFPTSLPVVGAWVVRLARHRLSAEQQVHQFVKYCFADRDRAPADYLDALRDLMSVRRRDDTHDQVVARAARSLMALCVRARRYDAALDLVPDPVLLVHGTRDRLVPVSAAHRALTRRPSWTGLLLGDVGHTAQLEAPDRVVEAVRAWLPPTTVELAV